ncbi:hypothetical protein KIPB_012358 [Kipferlia bialata]|uniref:Uncharacterized protein n=1 Tax=Kipferlia bialata TaxID=797122 RepID=A0A9K3GPG6_9EUKA|nr:hypothetical protein KIPB_012358 [Kipferlia bialata]|eukprot:g12358.t1
MCMYVQSVRALTTPSTCNTAGSYFTPNDGLECVECVEPAVSNDTGTACECPSGYVPVATVLASVLGLSDATLVTLGADQIHSVSDMRDQTSLTSALVTELTP